MLTIVTGTGYTGKRVLEQLPDDAAFGLSRSPLITTRATAVFDLDGEAVLPIDIPANYQIIYTVPPRPQPGDERLRHFLTLLNPAPQRFVYISTTGVYGDCQGRRVDESATLRPATERARRRVAAEELLRHWCATRNCELTILRTPGIYGPGRLGEQRVRGGEAILAEAEANPGNRIHVDDLADCCIAALGAPTGTCNVGDGDERSSTWFAMEVARQLGLQKPPEISRAEAMSLFSPQRLSFLAESRRIDTRRMREVLGIVPRYANAADGIRASLSEPDG